MGIFRKLFRRLGNWRDKLARPPLVIPSYAESISGGDQDYLAVCRDASLDPKVFADFRRNRGYTPILEHCTEEQGREYYRLLSPTGRAWSKLEEMAKNDRIGNPITF